MKKYFANKKVSYKTDAASYGKFYKFTSFSLNRCRSGVRVAGDREIFFPVTFKIFGFGEKLKTVGPVR